MSKVGRPKLPKRDHKIPCNFTVEPSAISKLQNIRRDKSKFISKILTKFPERWIREFNDNPDGFEPNF